MYKISVLLEREINVFYQEQKLKQNWQPPNN